jgi:hypothetical protein
LTDSSRDYWRNQRTSEVRTALSALGDGAPTWSPTSHRWGDENETCIELSTEDERIDEIRLRVDLRDAEGRHLREICAAVAQLDCLVVTETAQVIAPTVGEILAAARESAAARYVSNPRAYLHALHDGGVGQDEE